MLQTLFHVRLNWFLAVWALGSLLTLGWAARRQGWQSATRTYLPTLLFVGILFTVAVAMLGEADGLPIRGYGVMLLCGLMSGVGLAMYLARRMGLNPDMVQVLAFWMVLAGIVGARGFFVIEYWHDYQRPSFVDTIREIANFTKGGLVVFGSAIGAGLALLVFVRKYRLPGLALADLISPSVMLGLGFGRVGCFLNGCCFGGVCDEPWSVRFPLGSPPYMAQAKAGKLATFGLVFTADGQGRPVIQRVEPGSEAADAGLVAGQRIDRIRVNRLEYPTTTVDEALSALQLANHAGDQVLVYADSSLPASWTVTSPLRRTLPVHPAQLYAAVDALLLCLLLLACYPYRRRDGEVFALMITVHPISRFLQEIIRIDESSVFGTGLSISQNVSILILAGAIGLWIYLSWQPKFLVWPVRMAAAA